MRTVCFVDGYNMYYGLLAGTKFKWLNLKSFLSEVLRTQDPGFQLAAVNYFTSGIMPHLATRGIESKEAQDAYLKALASVDVNIVLGRHRLEPSKAPVFIDKNTPASRAHQTDIWLLEEKETDVNIAVGMYRLAAKQEKLPDEERIRQIVLVSADTDMTPALKAIREDFPDMKIGVIFPHRHGIQRNPPGSLLNLCDWARRFISETELEKHQFPERVPTRKKPAIKPIYW